MKLPRFLWLLGGLVCPAIPLMQVMAPLPWPDREQPSETALSRSSLAQDDNQGIIEQRVSRHPDGWLVETLKETGDPRIPLIRLQEVYGESINEENLLWRDAWCADRLVLSLSSADDTLSPETEARLEAMGFTVLSSYPFSPVRVYHLPDTAWGGPERWKQVLLAELEEAGLTLSRDHLHYPVATNPNDTRYPEQWALQAINAPEGWDLETGSPDAIVAVIDTGVYPFHTDFYNGPESNLWVNPEDPQDGIDNDGNGFIDDVKGWDFVTGTGTVMEDTYGHGTQVSGILAAYGNNSNGISGVAWRASVLPLRAGTFLLPNSVIAQGMDYATDLRVRGHNIVAINSSFGYYPSSRPTPEDWSVTNPLGQAIERARHASILVVAASGNNSQDNDSPTRPHFFPSDAIHHNLVSVSAITQDGSRWFGANYGVVSVDLAAPGLGVLTTSNSGGYGNVAGTSMAAPHVSGAAALLAANRPDLNTAWMRALILGTVAPEPLLDGLVVTGGVLDLGEMLQLAALPTEEAWKRLYWSESELAGMSFSWNDNSDSDEWPHIMELAFGGNPRLADSRPAVVADTAVWMDADSLPAGIEVTIRFPWSPLADGLLGWSYEYATDSTGPWYPVTPESLVEVDDDRATAIRTYEARFRLPADRVLWRLRVDFTGG